MKTILQNLLKYFYIDDVITILKKRGYLDKEINNICEIIQYHINTLKSLRKDLITFNHIKKIQGLDIEGKKKLSDIKLQIKIHEDKLLDILCSIPNDLDDKIHDQQIKIVFEHGNFTGCLGNKHNEILKNFNYNDVAKNTSGLGFLFLESKLAYLYRILGNILLENAISYGYKETYVPHIIKDEFLYRSGHLPKFKDILFTVGYEKKFLIPTSEVALLSIFANSVINKKDLPITLCSLSSCYRNEIGAPGAMNKGLFRLYQFEKVELFCICQAKDACDMFDKMIECAKNILIRFNLNFRIIELPRNDLGFTSYLTHDIEIWLPVTRKFIEVSSISICKNFQSLRSNIRINNNDIPYTLNGTALAIGRLVIALLEKYQSVDNVINFIKNNKLMEGCRSG